MNSQSQPKLLFIVGVWRSGTSLLYAMLNQHPKIALMFESEPFSLYPVKPDCVFPDDWTARLEFYNQAISRHRLEAAALPKNVSGRECMLAMFRTWAARKQATVMGGKSPSYHNWLPQVAEIFPEAHFIIIGRDPVACCRSAAQAARENRFFAQAGMQAQVLFGTAGLARGVEKLRRAGRRVHELTYEGLVADPETELRNICAFIGVDFDPQMLDLRHADFSMLPASENHTRVRSGELVKDTRRVEILPAEFVAKGRRYAALWRERFAPLKIAEAFAAAPGQAKPDEAERLRGWLEMGFWKLVLHGKRMVFRHIPLEWWAWLREQQNRRQAGRISSNQASLRSFAVNRPLTFSIVTPSFRNSAWLQLCIASVADQRGVAVEHIVQDSCSDDGTQDWLPHDPRVKAFIEKDAGMYDAVNRGYRRATGDILAYLNCDEQYLPGALDAVRKIFEENPHIEVLLAGSIVTDGEGNYLCHRHSMVPTLNQIWFRFPMLTSSIFLRRKVVAERGIYFDTKWRDLGDLHWIIALMKNRVPMTHTNEFTSTFADTGENMNLKPNARREMAETAAMIPPWLRLLKPLWIVAHRLRRITHGHFNLKPTSYAIYTKASPDHRVVFDVPKPTPIWWNRI